MCFIFSGALYGVFGSYKLPFFLAGCPSILCALMMFVIHRIKNHSDSMTEAEGAPKRKVSHLPDVNGNNKSGSSASENDDRKKY